MHCQFNASFAFVLRALCRKNLLPEIGIERATYVLGLERRLLMSLPSLAEPAPTAKGRNRLQMTPYSAPLTAVSIKIITRVFKIFDTFLRTLFSERDSVISRES